MSKLWVYGCSFSEPFQIETEDHVFDDAGYRILKADYWGTHLAKKLNLECHTKSLSGIGWNYIVHQIDLDTLKWSTDDIIIISPSFITRVNIMEYDSNVDTTELIRYYKSCADIITYNELRWSTKIKTLQHFGYNVFTWRVDEVLNPHDVTNLITAPGDLVNWKDWMDLHKEYWQDPTTNKYIDGDWHFNPQGHLAVANRMYEVITKCQLQ